MFVRVWYGEKEYMDAYGESGERKFGSESVFAWSYAVLLFEIPRTRFFKLFVIPALPVIMGTGLSGSVMILLVKPIGIILLKSSGVILWAYDRLCSAAVMLSVRGG